MGWKSCALTTTIWNSDEIGLPLHGSMNGPWLDGRIGEMCAFWETWLMASILVTEGPACGKQFALENHRLVMIGRDAACTFQIVDDQLSRMHVQIKFDENEGRHIAIDFKSRNGVYVNGSRISGETALSAGDAIQVGSSTLVYSEADPPDALEVRDMLRKRGEGGLETTAD